MKKLSLFLAMIMVVGLVAGCSSASMSTDSASATTAGAPENAMEAPMVEESVSMDTTLESAETPAADQVDYAEKIIYSAYLYLETTIFDGTIASVEDLVNVYGGFVEGSAVDGHTVYHDDGTSQVIDRFAIYTLRIPSENFEAALNHAGTLGNVVSSNRQAENITSAFYDQEALKNSLEVQEERLIYMMEQSEDIETLIALEARISEVRYEIDGITRQLTNWQREVDYSTVEIAVQEVEIYTPTVQIQRTFGEKIRDSFQAGLNNFANGCQALVIFLVGNVLNLLVFAVVVTVALVIVVKIRGKRKKCKDTKTDETP